MFMGTKCLWVLSYHSQMKGSANNWLTVVGLQSFDEGNGSVLGVRYAEAHRILFSKTL